MFHWASSRRVTVTGEALNGRNQVQHTGTTRGSLRTQNKMIERLMCTLDSHDKRKESKEEGNKHESKINSKQTDVTFSNDTHTQHAAGETAMEKNSLTVYLGDECKILATQRTFNRTEARVRAKVNTPRQGNIWLATHQTRFLGREMIIINKWWKKMGRQRLQRQTSWQSVKHTKVFFFFFFPTYMNLCQLWHGAIRGNCTKKL